MLDDKQREYAARLIPRLGPMGACPRCVMRFIGVSSAEQYSRPQAAAWTELCASVDGAAPATACPDASKCCVCMGVLALIDDADAVAGLLSKLGETALRSPAFVLEVALPSSVYVRQRGAFLDVSAAVGRDAMPRNDHITEAKNVLKMQFADAIAQRLGATRDDKAARYHVTINVEHRACEEESRAVVDGTAPSSERGPKRQRAGDASSSSVRSVLKALFEVDCRDRLVRAKLCPPGAPSEACEVSLTTFHDPICVGGRYNKYARTMPQTPWWLDGEKHGVSSVQEEMETALLAAYAARSSSFHGAGREDIDVRMLGSGRPFVLELMEPTALECGTAYGTLLPELEARINSSCPFVQVNGLQVVHPGTIAGLVREGEAEHRKSYRCVVWLSRPVSAAEVAAKLDNAGSVRVEQKTPIRVLHRRPLLTRPRTVFSMRAELLNARYLQLDLVTQAGTYVKEFVHGDFGRTFPNVGSLLGCSADILQLDVLGILDHAD